MAAAQTIGSREIQAAITRLAAAIAARHPVRHALLLLGIANGGIELACRLARITGARAGVLDVSFHRDDIAHRPIPRERVPTHIPADVTNGTVILIDDVLFSGRTIKAALDELFDHGRPTKVELAVLVDRGCRRLPLAADYASLAISTEEDEKVEVVLDPTSSLRDRIRVWPEDAPARTRLQPPVRPR